MTTKTPDTAGERRRQVAESACTNPDCAICRDYVLTGKRTLRPVSREQYLAALRASYPDGVPEQHLPAWAAEVAQ